MNRGPWKTTHRGTLTWQQTSAVKQQNVLYNRKTIFGISFSLFGIMRLLSHAYQALIQKEFTNINDLAENPEGFPCSPLKSYKIIFVHSHTRDCFE